MKYIIEIEDEPFVRQSALYGEEAVYRAKGFKSLVFDQNGLDKLRPLGGVVEDAYDRGYDVGFSEGKETGMNQDRDFEVGDEVINEELETAYVLVPTYGDKSMFVSSEYECPQIVLREGWRKTGNRSVVFAKAFKDFVEAYQGEEK